MMACKTKIRLLIVLPLLIIFSAGVWVGINMLVERKIAVLTQEAGLVELKFYPFRIPKDQVRNFDREMCKLKIPKYSKRFETGDGRLSCWNYDKGTELLVVFATSEGHSEVPQVLERCGNRPRPNRPLSECPGLSDATRLVVHNGGYSREPLTHLPIGESRADTIIDLSRREEIASLTKALEIDMHMHTIGATRRRGERFGGPTLEFYCGEKPIVSVTVIDGHSLRCAGDLWTGGCLTDASVRYLSEWLKKNTDGGAAAR